MTSATLRAPPFTQLIRPGGRLGCVNQSPARRRVRRSSKDGLEPTVPRLGSARVIVRTYVIVIIYTIIILHLI